MKNISKHEKLIKVIYKDIWRDTLKKRELKKSDVERVTKVLIDSKGMPYIGKGLALQILLGCNENIGKCVKKRQLEIAALLTSVKIFLPTIKSLHITVFPFYLSVDRSKIKLSKEDIDFIKFEISKHSQFEITFKEISLSKGDFILEGHVNDDSLMSIRKSLSERFQEVPKFTNLVHTTIARIFEPLSKQEYALYKEYVKKHKKINPQISFNVDRLSMVTHFDSMSINSAIKDMRLKL